MKMTQDGEKTTFLLLAVALAVWVVIAFFSGLNGPFVSDDYSYILNNPRITETPLSQFWLLFSNAAFIEYLPIRDLSYLIEYPFFGDNPFGYKLTNLLLYLLLLVLLYQLTYTLVRIFMSGVTASQMRYLALAVTAIYALYPVHVESVTWVSGRKDLLATLFAVLSFWQFCLMLTYAESATQQWLKPLAISILALVLALLSKAAVAPVGVVMGAVALAFFMERHAPRQAIIQALRYSLPLLLTVLLMTWLHSRIGVQGGIGITASEMPPEIIGNYFERVFHILGALTQIALWPFDLRLIYDAYPDGGLLYLRFLLAAATIIAGLWGAWRFITQRSLIGLGALLFLLFNLPYLQIIPFQTWSLVSERFLITSSYGVVLALVLLLHHYLKGRIFIGAMAVLMVIFSYTTIQRVAEWQSADRLYLANYQMQPTLFYSAYLKLKLIDIAQGNYQDALQTAQAIDSSPYRAAVINLVQFYQAIAEQKAGGGVSSLQMAAQALSQMHQNLNQAKSSMQNYADANYYLAMGLFLRNVYLTFLEYDPNNAYLHYNLGLLSVNFNPRFAATGAAESFSKAIELDGLDRLTESRAWNHLGLIYISLQRFDEAQQAFIRADQLNPADSKAAYNLVLLDVLSGQREGLTRSSEYFRQRAQQLGIAPAEIERRLEQAYLQ